MPNITLETKKKKQKLLLDTTEMRFLYICIYYNKRMYQKKKAVGFVIRQKEYSMGTGKL